MYTLNSKGSVQVAGSRGGASSRQACPAFPSRPSSSSAGRQERARGPAPYPSHSQKPSRTRLDTGISATATAPEPTIGIPKLADLELQPFINVQGNVAGSLAGVAQDAPAPGAYVFAVYDAQQKLQYIGFSQNLRNSLRTLLGRRNEKAHYYKGFGLPTLDQPAMIDIRDAWFEQVGGAPPGNKLQLERTLWQTPVDAGAISARGKRGAAEDMARQLIAILKQRGCKEEFVPNPTLLDDGLVDFLPAAGISAEEEASLRAAQEAAARETRTAKTVIDGEERAFHVRVLLRQDTNKGSAMMDVAVTIDNRETQHRIIVGNQYIGGAGLTSPEPAVEAAMAVLLSQKVVRHTEGLLGMDQFPSNYFTVSAVEQWWAEDFAIAFERATGINLPAVRLPPPDSISAPGSSKSMVQDKPDVAWHFMRRYSYGAAIQKEQEELDALLNYAIK